MIVINSSSEDEKRLFDGFCAFTVEYMKGSLEQDPFAAQFKLKEGSIWLFRSLFKHLQKCSDLYQQNTEGTLN